MQRENFQFLLCFAFVFWFVISFVFVWLTQIVFKLFSYAERRFPSSIFFSSILLGVSKFVSVWIAHIVSSYVIMQREKFLENCQICLISTHCFELCNYAKICRQRSRFRILSLILKFIRLWIIWYHEWWYCDSASNMIDAILDDIMINDYLMYKILKKCCLAMWKVWKCKK